MNYNAKQSSQSIDFQNFKTYTNLIQRIFYLPLATYYQLLQMRNKKFNIGCSGFYNRHWKGVFYPEELPAKEWFEFYCHHFNTLELNVTFYRFPTVRTLQNWYRKSPEDFVFSVKANKQITHIKKFQECKTLIEEFYRFCAEGLQEKLGCILFQLPPSFQFSPEKLDLLISNLNPDFKNVIEFRHESWWTEPVLEALRKNKITICSVSHPTLPQTILSTSEIAYVRLHGNEKMFYSAYSDDFLQEMSKAIKELKNVKEAFVYFNNTASTAGILNALEMKNLNSK